MINGSCWPGPESSLRRKKENEIKLKEVKNEIFPKTQLSREHINCNLYNIQIFKYSIKLFLRVMRQQVLIILKIIINKQMSVKSMRRENFLFFEELQLPFLCFKQIFLNKETEKIFRFGIVINCYWFQCRNAWWNYREK